MESQTYAYTIGTSGVDIFTVFGYTTKGIPGIEIVGAGKHAKTFKEKIIYLSKQRELPIPKRRYVLCVDALERSASELGDEIRWLELPLILVYWHLAKLIPISKLHDCLSSGKIHLTGKIEHPKLNGEFSHRLNQHFSGAELASFKHITNYVEQEDLPFFEIKTSHIVPYLECVG